MFMAEPIHCRNNTENVFLSLTICTFVHTRLLPTSLQIVTPFNVKIRLLKWTAVTEGMDIPPHIAPRQINTSRGEFLYLEVLNTCLMKLAVVVLFVCQHQSQCWHKPGLVAVPFIVDIGHYNCLPNQLVQI